jgi:glutamyl-tRNA synthetase
MNPNKNNHSFALRSRLAPTPSGFLHLGNVFSFALTWLIVRQQKGSLLLRIDDLDSQRRRIAYLDDIFQTLEWLGIDYDEGASGTEDFLKNFSQEYSISEYEKLLNELLNISPPLVYACSCSRKEIQKNSLNGLYTGFCRSQKILNQHQTAQKSQAAWRIEVPLMPIHFQDVLKGESSINLAEKMGDFIIRRKDQLPAYQIASLSDDLKYRINFIVRGEDLIDSTAAQLFLAQLLKKENFTKTSFLHHPLLYEKGEHKIEQKMSKSHDSLSIKALREQLIIPKPIIQWIAEQLGIRSSISTLQHLLEEFELSQIPSKLYFPHW